MKIEYVKIENFRSFANETVYFDDYTCLVGPNGSGKSTVLCALNVFFREYSDSVTDLSKLNEQDFHHKKTSDPIRITVSFKDLSDDAKTDLADYVRNDRLIVSAVARYDKGSERAEVRQYGNRLGFEEFRVFFEHEKTGMKVKELKEVYQNIQDKFKDLANPGTKDAMIQALREYEVDHADECVLIPSVDEFYGVSKGKNRLEKYIQWVYVAAVKDATDEQAETKTSALGQLLARTVRSRVNFTESIEKLRQKLREDYEGILAAEEKVLEDLSQSLESRLKTWSHPDTNVKVRWHHDPDKSIKVEAPLAQIQVGERGFEGELGRFGHGLQRSYIIALLQELSSLDDENSPTLVLGCEEPELYQHPPQARYLSQILQELATSNSQIIVSTHSPFFISGENFENVRMIRSQGEPPFSRAMAMPLDELAKATAREGKKAFTKEGMLAKVNQALTPNLNEIFFTQTLVLVEGFEDVAFLNTYLVLTGNVDKFRKFGGHIVAAFGKSEIPKPAAIARFMGVPTFVIFDCDSDVDEKYLPNHKVDNEMILKVCGYNDEEPLQDATVWKDDLVMWSSNIGEIVLEEIPGWETYEDQATIEYGKPGGLKKNSLAIGYALERAWAEGNKSESLEKLCTKIIEFAETNHRI